MIGAKHLIDDCQSALEEWLGLGVTVILIESESFSI